MDINRLTIKEQNEYMKKGKCFQCGQTGHVSHDHATNPTLNTGKGSTSNSRKPATPYKAIMPLPNKNTAQKVCAIMAGLDDKELEEAKVAFIESLDKDPNEPAEEESDDEDENKGFQIRSVPNNDLNSMCVNTRIINGKKTVETKVFIDSGAQGIFMDERFAKEHRLPLLRLDKEIQVSNVDESPNKNGPIRFYTRLLQKSMEKINPEVNWTKKTIKIIPDRIKKPNIRQAIDREIQILKIESERKKMKSKEAFADQLRKIPDRRNKKKRSTVFIEEIPDEDATPKFERLADNEEAILITVNELPNQYEDMPALVPNTEDDEEDESEGDLVTAYLQEETITTFKPEKEEPLNQPIQIDSDLAIRAKTSISQIFEKKASERFPESRPWDHRIDLKPDFVPKRSKLYPLGQKEEEEMNKFIDEKGFIKPSNSPQASPFFFVSKKDSKALRPCQDYHYLNSYTVKNTYPLPSIDDLLNKLQGATVFTKLDIQWGYNNVQIKQGDEWKGAFITKRGLFELTVMFFGMTNSPATFQAMMNDYFADMITQGWVLIYLDDILIFSKDPKHQHGRTEKVLTRLEEKDLFLKPEKCVFNAKEVEYLGFIIRPNEIPMDPTKLAGIQDWIPPKNVKGIRSFLGFGNFYRRFIGNYAETAKPLNELTKKMKVFKWSQECQTAFDNLKKKFLEKPILIIPDPTKPFYVESDASKWATGAVLRQRDTNGDLKPCSYISHSFTQTERNYNIYDRELLGII
ncbi:reverse transcriptase-RNase H-integrase [Laccaria bicolor S238N-H82]|uniref:Reverse transcriptase-RNase H-integrase n=1 Tax=Laccaria bicolor (strain S238N-H82 / ATCC MYA-4686) TaxID=486041 RepID=B0DER8_LACBS|nr:reverse transcriptase-RNase H-integrase [Laccaria bicolor S238N-H82]EDR07074.1 reverse transcriptase-RNase H-integrase [Laccaria bicolor S238N-H82]|eukprot:XP_001882447.1 reverse transcriptase-RNase H-integrase [Laccaria bicolor S238N-H82]